MGDKDYHQVNLHKRVSHVNSWIWSIATRPRLFCLNGGVEMVILRIGEFLISHCVWDEYKIVLVVKIGKFASSESL